MIWQRCIPLSLLLLPISCNRAGFTQPPSNSLDLDRTELRFSAKPGEIVPVQKVTITNPAGLPVDWVAQASEPWILISPTESRTPSVLSVRVNPNGKLPGEYSGTITLTGSEEQDSLVGRPSEIWIGLTVSAPGWTAANGPYGGAVLAVASDGVPNGRVLAGDARGRIWIADDGGKNFRLGQTIGGTINDLEIDGTNGVAYAASGTTGLWRSLDAGSTWKQTTLVSGSSQLALKSGDPDTIYVLGSNALTASYDGGVTWSAVRTEDAFCVSTGPVLPDEVFTCGYRKQIYQSSDSGQNWTSLSCLDIQPSWVLRDPQAPQNIFVSCRSSWGFVISRDSGVTWVEAAVGLPKSYVHEIQRFGANLILAQGGGLFQSTDGVAWSAFPIVVPLASKEFRSIAYSGAELLAAHVELGVLAGTDRLDTTSGIIAHTIVDLAVHPLTGAVLALTSNNGVWRFDRMKARWTSMPDSLLRTSGLGQSNRHLARDPADSERLLLALCEGGILESLDDGRTWATSGANSGNCVRYLAWAGDDAATVYAASDPALLVSHDRGLSFSVLTTAPYNLVAIAPLPGGEVVYVSYRGDVWLHTATGSEETLAQGVHADNEVTVADDGGVWVGGETGIWYLPPGARTFEMKAANQANSPVTGIVVDGNQIWISHNGRGLQRSSDGGITWEDMRCPTTAVTALFRDPLDGTFWIGTSELGVLKFSP